MSALPDPGVPTAILAPGGEQIVDYVPPCLTGATTDNPVVYELGAAFRPIAIGTVTAAVLVCMVAIILGRRINITARVGIVAGALFLLLLSAGMGVLLWRVPEYVAHTEHVHADVAIQVRGQMLDLADDRFQSTEGHVLSDYAHFHDGNGHIIHGHATGVTYGYFLWTIGLPLRGSCMVQPSGEPLCNEGAFRWMAFVDGVFEPNLRDRPIADLERVLLTYTDEPEDAIRRDFIHRVTDEACIPSKKCPERGRALPESCDL